MRPAPNGGRVGEGWRSSLEKRISPEQKNKKKGDNPAKTGSKVAALELFDPGYQVLKFRIRDLDLAFDTVNFVQQLPYPDIHQVDDELLDYNNAAKQNQHVSFVCHGNSKNGIT